MESKDITSMLNFMHREEFIQWFEDNHTEYVLVKGEDIDALEDELDSAISYIEASGVDWEEVKGE